MNSLKAIIFGIIFIATGNILLQLAYLIIIVVYNKLATTYSLPIHIHPIINYIILIPLILGIMFSGGYLTALIAKKNVLILSIVVGVITTSVMMWMALENANLTSIGIIINFLLIITTIAGSLYWRRKSLIVLR